MATGMRISFSEMLLMKGIIATKFKFVVDGVSWSWSDHIDQYVGKRNVNKALDSAVSNGLVELEPNTTEEARGVKLTSLGQRLLKAAEPEFLAAHSHAA